MKSVHATITITNEMVVQFESIFGKQTTLPPTFPMIFYQYFDIPWKYDSVPIHRKQSCFCESNLLIGASYQCTVTLEKVRQKGVFMFYIQSLIGHDSKGSECFKCVSEFVVPLR